MRVDFHTHWFPDCVAMRAMAGMSKMTEGVLWPVGDGTLTNLLDQLALAHFDYAVSCPIATRPSQFEIIFRTACALRAGAYGVRAQRQLIPLASIHPQDPAWAAHLEAIAAAGIRGVKFHPYYQGFSLADRAVWPLFKRMAELGLMAVCHCGADVGFPQQMGFCGPAEIVALLKAVENLTFVAAHLGGCVGAAPHATDEVLARGAYVDTSVLMRDWHRDEVMRLLRSWPRERILFGTDFPWVSPLEAVRWVSTVRVQADWPLLFGGNAQRLLGLTEAEAGDVS